MENYRRHRNSWLRYKHDSAATSQGLKEKVRHRVLSRNGIVTLVLYALYAFLWRYKSVISTLQDWADDGTTNRCEDDTEKLSNHDEAKA